MGPAPELDFGDALVAPVALAVEGSVGLAPKV